MSVHDLMMLFEFSNQDLVDIISTGPSEQDCKKFMRLGGIKHRTKDEQFEFECYKRVFENYAEAKRVCMSILKDRNGRTK